MNVTDFIPPVVTRAFRQLRHKLNYKERYERGEVLTSRLRTVLERNKSLVDKHRGERCFILATGSSIRHQDLKPLKNELCFGLNEFFLHEDFQSVKPRYMIFSGFGIHSKIPREKRIPWYQNFDSVTGGVSIPIINISDYDLIEENQLLNAKEKYFMQYLYQLSDIESKGLDPVNRMYSSASVSVMAVQVALIMGFREIVLVGFDHDWLWRMFDKQPTHFYDHNSSIIYKGISEVEGISVISELQSTLNLFQNYVDLKKYADKKGVSILNATAGGTLDVFPRKELDSFYEKV